MTGSTPLFLHQDQLGSTVAVTDAAVTVEAVTAYDPQGNPTSGAVASLTPIGFAGALSDPASGFDYLVHRWYDPATAQFTSVDPAVAITQDPYGYVGDSPLDGVDPLGLRGLNVFADLADVWDTGVVALTDPAATLQGAEWIGGHTAAATEIVGGATLIVGGAVLTEAVAGLLMATTATLASESAIGGIEAVDVGVHGLLALAPGVGVMLGGAGLSLTGIRNIRTGSQSGAVGGCS